VNLAEVEQRHPNIEPLVGDATDLGTWEDDSFDIVFSNSVIEHLETLEAQAAMAREVRRLAPSYWVQTPTSGFPWSLTT
jgi:predicted SAM-dependent methyltransferase